MIVRHSQNHSQNLFRKRRAPFPRIHLAPSNRDLLGLVCTGTRYRLSQNQASRFIFLCLWLFGVPDIHDLSGISFPFLFPVGRSVAVEIL